MRSHRACATLVACKIALAGGSALAAPPVVVDQQDRHFTVRDLDVAAGDTVRFTNTDDFSHQVYVASPAFTAETDEKDPGQSVDVRFPVPGTYDVRCHIHPGMIMHVRVH